MAIKRKPAPSHMKAAKTKKKGTGTTPARKAPARTVAKKSSSPKVAVPKPASAKAKPAPVKANPKPAPAPVAKTGKPVVGKPVPGKFVGGKPVLGKPVPGKPVKGGKTRLKVVSTNPPVVRPIGVLPPEAVARAIRAVPAPVQRPARPVPPARKPAVAAADSGGGVTEKDYKEFEQRLLAERQKILKEMGHLESTVLKVNQRESAGDLSGYSFHMADVGTDAMEREKAFMFASNEGHLLQEIDHALRKLYRGEFGPCENCSKPITRARLEAMPYARLCLTCKEEEERSNRGSQ